MSTLRDAGRNAALAMALGAMVTAACGTTVPRTTANEGGTGGGLAAGGAGLSAPAGKGTSSSGSATTDGLAASGTIAEPFQSAGNSVGGSSGPSATSSTGTTGPVVPSVFKIGTMSSANANAALASLGSGGGNATADADAGNAVLAYVNAHGGIAGRPAVYAVNNVDATATPQQESEQACAQWAQDDHVTLAVPGSAVEDNDLLRTCLGKAGIPALYGSIYSDTPNSSFASSPLWFEYSTLSTDEYARTYIRGLSSQGFFKSGKVGVVYYDQPPFSTTLTNTLLPELKAAGVTNPDTFGADITGVSDLGSGVTQMASAVLRFRSDGVTKVLFFEPWVGYFVFLRTATTQGYAPMYGLSSQEAPDVAMSLGVVSASELTGARIVSWIPVGDVLNLNPYLGPLTPLCTSIFKSHNVAIQPTSDRLDYSIQYGGCETLLLIQAAYQHAGRTIVAGDFARGMAALGSSVQFATRPVGSFSTTKHYGLSEFWNGHFNSGCGCFVYDDGPHPLPSG